jgi:hypothetical protein
MLTGSKEYEWDGIRWTDVLRKSDQFLRGIGTKRYLDGQNFIFSLEGEVM